IPLTHSTPPHIVTVNATASFPPMLYSAHPTTNPPPSTPTPDPPTTTTTTIMLFCLPPAMLFGRALNRFPFPRLYTLS
ncbi:hypothetical protein AB9E28_36090, partial [Rhizobium leguminosarum]|uniref:hypothetical protein n=1 Tax=Rhizobium leguminosarum TaxID=384 RepID=UPI003F9C7A12